MPTMSIPTRVRGQSLVSVLVGVVISLLTIAAMLALYRNVIDVSGEASRSALRDGNVASALTSAQIYLEEAGFGIEPENPLATKFILTQNSKQVVWRYKQHLDGTDVCAGLQLIDATNDAGVSAARGFFYLTPKECTQTTISSVSWTPVERIALLANASADPASAFLSTKETAKVAEVGGLSLQPQSTAGYTFRLEPESCLPYRQQSGALNAVQRLSLAATDQDVLFSACLPNLKSL